MDARVNDFLNEIDEIAPLNENKEEYVWEKCYDEESGYHYYWNIKTNEVTWDMPPEYKSLNKTKTKKTSNLYIPPRTAPLFPSTHNLLPPVSDAIKIYKIGECAGTIPGSSTRSDKAAKGEKPKPKEEKKTVKRKPLRKSSDSDDEKIVLISSYSGDSDSEEEKEDTSKNKLINGSKPSLGSEDDDEVAKLKSSQLQVCESDNKYKSTVVAKKPENKEISGFSLVAGYSDSDEEQDESSRPNFLIGPPPQEKKISHSTLFPATKPIDVKDFAESPKGTEGDEGFDSKAFQRKRRIGVALINAGKKAVIDDDNERKGLGFSNDSNSGDNSSSPYTGFKSGGVMFVKADVLNPTSIEEKPEDVVPIEETYTTLKEKLGFLSEGREEVSPVQAMLIQLETLYIALKSGNLKQTYLKQWLDEKCSELIKLEKEATPEGWLLQWDSQHRDVADYFRSHKRYYYQNASTGESQWEYPQADVTVCDEAMDICTTPPPTEPTIHMSPPLPPIIGSPSPPPAPSISDCKSSKKKKCDIPLPPEPKKDVSGERYASNGEPFPPGVDTSDVTTKTRDTKRNDMTDVLNSFYSDIAAIETSTSPPVSSVTEEPKPESTVDSVQEPMKKKKKTKVKLAQGIAMKKKGVSKLVEKWKNVQLSYND